MSDSIHIEAPTGKLGVLLPGLGAVATTFIAGVAAIRKGIAKPVGSLTQMGTVRLGQRTEKRIPLIKDFIALAGLDDLVFGGWDIFTDDIYLAARKAGVLSKDLLDEVRFEIEEIQPWKAVFDQDYVKKLSGEHVKEAANKYELAQLLMEDIQRFKETHDLERMVMVWCASTEIFLNLDPVFETMETFVQAMKDNHPAIAPSMIYAYAAIASGVPFANGAPNLSADIPALIEFAKETNVPLAGKDFKTGQTLMKTMLAPGFQGAYVGVSRLVFHQHLREPGRRSAGRTAIH